MLVDELAHEAARRLKLKYPQSEGAGSDRLRQRRTDNQPCMRPVEVSRRVGDCFLNVSRGRLMACALARGLPASCTLSNKYIQHVKTIYETYRPSSRVLCAFGYPIVFLSIGNVRLLYACCSELQEARCEVPVIPPATLIGR